jgi:anti-sigma factor (TIGR02949 family)
MRQRIDRIDCNETFRRLDDYLDRELTPEEMRLVVEHLEVCAFCMLEFQFEARVLHEVRSKLRAIPVPAHLMDTIRRALVEADGAAETE